MNDNDELARLRRALAEEQRRRKEEQRRREEEQLRREEAENRRKEEQRRREEAESRAKKSQPLRLEPYLKACHTLSLAIEVVTDPTMTTQGGATDPVGRVYPRRIIPWDDFPERQGKIWNQLFDPSFTSEHIFPSEHQMEYVRSIISPISSEHGLRYYERETVENAVQKLVSAVYKNPRLRRRFSLRGTVTFESHTNLGPIDSEPFQLTSLSGDSAGDIVSVRPPRRAVKIKGKGNRADQFCIYSTSDSARVPAMAIEYKAPHKLTQDEIVTGLASEIQPDRDVINKDDKGFAFAAKWLTAAIVT